MHDKLYFMVERGAGKFSPALQLESSREKEKKKGKIEKGEKLLKRKAKRKIILTENLENIRKFANLQLIL